VVSAWQSSATHLQNPVPDGRQLLTKPVQGLLQYVVNPTFTVMTIAIAQQLAAVPWLAASSASACTAVKYSLPVDARVKLLTLKLKHVLATEVVS
jgi:hypothetical protein